MPHDTEIDDETMTTDVTARWHFLGSALALLLVSSIPLFAAAHAYGLVDISSVPQAWYLLYATAAITAVVWTFGKGAFKQAKGLLGNE